MVIFFIDVTVHCRGQNKIFRTDIRDHIHDVNIKYIYADQCAYPVIDFLLHMNMTPYWIHKARKLQDTLQVIILIPCNATSISNQGWIPLKAFM